VYHDNVRNRNDLNNTSYLDAVERNSKILSSQDNEHVRRWRVIRENKPKHHIKQYKPGVGNLFYNTDRKVIIHESQKCFQIENDFQKRFCVFEEKLMKFLLLWYFWPLNVLITENEIHIFALA